MKTIIILIAIFIFHSCTSSGKLTDAKFPHNKITGLSVMTFVSRPLDIDYTESAELMSARMHLKVIVILTLAFAFISIILGICIILRNFKTIENSILTSIQEHEKDL